MNTESSSPNWIAQRTLITNDANKENIEIFIGKPEVTATGTFQCAYQVVRRNIEDNVQYVKGIDSFQALMLAFEGIRNTIDKTGLSVTWQGGEPGDHGFTRFVPQYYFGREFSKRLEKIIEDEVEAEIKKFSNVKREKSLIAGQKPDIYKQ